MNPKASAKSSTPKERKTSVAKIPKDIDPFFTQVSHQDDFARIVLGAAKVDSCLARLLDDFLLDSTTKDGMLNHNGIVGSFASRAKLAYTLGLISKEAFSDMGILAELRNEVAHHPLKTSFQDKHVREKIDKLSWLDFWIETNYGQWSQKIKTQLSDQWHDKYNLTITLMCAVLESRRVDIEKIKKYVEPLSTIRIEFLDSKQEVINELPEHLKNRRG